MKSSIQNHPQDIILRNEIITKAFYQYGSILEAISASEGRFYTRKDDVQLFFAKFCNKNIEKTIAFFFGDKSTPGLIIKSYKNHIIDLIRKDNAAKNIKTIL